MGALCDCDWYESTLLSLNCLYQNVADTGFVVIDDYYTWDGCSRAVHEFLFRNPSTRRIHQFDNEICVLAPHKF